MWAVFECFCYNLFFISKKSITFAADKTAKCVQMQAKNNFSSSVSFNIFYLVEPNKSVTHTHTHTFYTV